VLLEGVQVSSFSVFLVGAVGISSGVSVWSSFVEEVLFGFF